MFFLIFPGTEKVKKTISDCIFNFRVEKLSSYNFFVFVLETMHFQMLHDKI